MHALALLQLLIISFIYSSVSLLPYSTLVRLSRSVVMDVFAYSNISLLMFQNFSFHPPGAPSSLKSKLNVTLKIHRSVLGNHHARVPLSSACTQVHAARGKKYDQIRDVGAAACVDIMEKWGYGSNDCKGRTQTF